VVCHVISQYIDGPPQVRHQGKYKRVHHEIMQDRTRRRESIYVIIRVEISAGTCSLTLPSLPD
jgi:hypothetical protein